MTSPDPPPGEGDKVNICAQDPGSTYAGQYSGSPRKFNAVRVDRVKGKKKQEQHRRRVWCAAPR